MFRNWSVVQVTCQDRHITQCYAVKYEPADQWFDLASFYGVEAQNLVSCGCCVGFTVSAPTYGLKYGGLRYTSQ